MTKYKLMPETATPEMCIDGERDLFIWDRYKAMYAAAPEAPRLSKEDIQKVIDAQDRYGGICLTKFAQGIEKKVRGE